jgi:hypothetical protein
MLRPVGPITTEAEKAGGEPESISADEEGVPSCLIS